MQNRLSWQSPALVAEYVRRSGLQPPEQAILHRLRFDLPQMRMLDIGVGGGRTTAHFVELAKQYVGIDYSEPMVQACRRRFASTRAQFLVADAADLGDFDDGQFDFILFSFNGIDYVSHDERLKILCEIQRVARPGAVFCFSTHNLQFVPNLNPLRAQFSRRPVTTIRRLTAWALWHLRYGRKLDRAALSIADHAVLNDGSYGCALNTYYVRPQAQLAQLENGFCNVEVYCLDTGQEIDHAALDRAMDPWLYYWCEVKRR
jgi:SAM-dependent methyltransferase